MLIRKKKEFVNRFGLKVMFSYQLCSIELDSVDWKLTYKSDMVPPKSIELLLLARRILIIRLFNFKSAETDLWVMRKSHIMLFLVVLLIDILYVNASNEYFNNLINTVNKQRKLQRLTALKIGENNWNFEERGRESQRKVCEREFLETNIFQRLQQNVTSAQQGWDKWVVKAVGSHSYFQNSRVPVWLSVALRGFSLPKCFSLVAMSRKQILAYFVRNINIKFYMPRN